MAGSNPFVKMGRITSIFEQKPDVTVFNFERMEELSVLMVLEIDVKFLIPHNSSMAFYVDQFEEICMAY